MQGRLTYYKNKPVINVISNFDSYTSTFVVQPLVILQAHGCSRAGGGSRDNDGCLARQR